MRLSRRVSLSEKKENRRLSSLRTRTKHKKLDAINENVYKLNHRSSKTEDKADVDEGEPRRSTRVRRAPVLLDASPLPAKKRRRVDSRNESVSSKKGKRREGVSGNAERESDSWGNRLRDRAIIGKKPKRDILPRRKRRLFVEDNNDFIDDVELKSSMSTVVKSKRPGRIKASSTTHKRESSADEARSSESNEDEEDTDSKSKSDASDHEENYELNEGSLSESDEDGEDSEENEVDDEEGNSEAEDKEENDEMDEGETSESDEDKEESENNNIGDHKGKKRTRNDEEIDEVEIRRSSNSRKDGEGAVGNKIDDEKGKNKVRDVEKNNDVDFRENEKEETESSKDKNNGVEYKGSDKVAASTEMSHLLPNGDTELNDDNTGKQAEEEVSRGGDNLETMEVDEQVELPNSNSERLKCKDYLTTEVSIDQTEIGRPSEKSLDNGHAKKRYVDTNERRYLKVGRKCGLCGTGTDGKLPKKIVGDGSGSDHEVSCGGSSASEDVKYDCYDGFGEEPGWLGQLLGPINDRYGIAGIWVHQNCAVWSPEVYFAGLGCLKNVRAALSRGRALKCTRCSRTGATIGCRVDRCPKTYHLPCARANSCIFDHRKFLIACTDHRHLFQPHGVQYLHKIKKLKARKLKLEVRKISGDAWRKDLEAEEKHLENCGEDEEFLKRESKRLHRDLLRIAPVYIGGSNSNSESQFQGWESVAGLQNVIQSLKEVVMLPLLYPDFFSNMGITPPRGVLLHGYPGTGKTLVVRALIGACASGDKRIAYFARKGADCLGKYVGDAERQLRLLFQVAEKSQPSIIFFDEIDGLAPCRTRQQDQTHNSVVSTLLALMDGLKSRGSVVVIGATNRPDSVDPALRRPGRFDREIFFPLPSAQDREAILSLHTRKWPKPVTGSLLKQIAKRTAGFAGADLQSLCTQAAITALRRSCPFQEILSAAEKKGPLGKHPPLPTFVVEERDWLEALKHAPPPCSQRGTEMAANDVISSPLGTHLVPCLLQPLTVFLASLCRDERIWLPSMLRKTVMLVKSVFFSALNMEKFPGNNWAHIHDMVLEADVMRDVEINLSRCGIVIGQASDSSSNVGYEDADNNKLDAYHPRVQQASTRPSLWKNVSCGSEKKIGFWLLISGSPRCGQRYLASCLLHCFTGNLEIQKIDSATIAQEGQGDSVQGITRILMKCASAGSSLIFMPRIDLWAIETYSQLEEESDSSSKNSGLPGQEEAEVSEMDAPRDDSVKTSLIWNMFVEQVESISVSSSLTILATSELPFEALPNAIRQFFQKGRSNSRSSSPLEETIPRFSVDLDGQFNRDSVLNSSAIELSKDLVQQYVQLAYQRNHVHVSPCTDTKSWDTLETVADNHIPGNEAEKALPAESSLMQFSSPSGSRPSKGKSNMLMTVSALGFQILKYPHFAELCWATSKLKEGPCADTKGPWKGWPFNSCFIRPQKTTEKVAVAGNIKSRENYGLVRGLIAVGLSAYRGTYTSVREVSREIRKVLELLADKINAKIRAGKDPHQYLRLLSQMAYFEDVVNSWAYSLQSPEEDAEATNTPSSNVTNLNSCDTMPSEDITEPKDGSEANVSAKISKKTIEQKDGDEPTENSDTVLEEITITVDLNEAMEVDNSNLEERIIADKSPEQLLEEDENNKITGHHLSDNGVCGSYIPNGFADVETVVVNEDGIGSDDITLQDNINQHKEGTVETSISLEDRKLSSISESNQSSGVICIYSCCSDCLVKLREKIEKILTYEWGLREEHGFTVEDVQDLFSSVSMNLHSYLRKMFVADSEKDQEEMKQNGVFRNQEKANSQCIDSEDGSMRLKECGCHSTTLSQDKDLKFLCREGVVSPLDPEEITCLNVHCKLEKLCFCSLIELIETAKQPSG